MLFRSNLLALVGTGNNPAYPPHKVMIWDDHQNMCIAELTFRTPVKSTLLPDALPARERRVFWRSPLTTICSRSS